MRIDLQDGFNQDTVTLTVNAQVVYHNTEVTTDCATALADSITVESDDELVDLEIALGEKHIQSKTRLNPAATPFIGVSACDDQIMIKLSSQSFLYSLQTGD